MGNIGSFPSLRVRGGNAGFLSLGVAGRLWGGEGRATDSRAFGCDCAGVPGWSRRQTQDSWLLSMTDHGSRQARQAWPGQGSDSGSPGERSRVPRAGVAAERG